jgi:O-acetyl-ADP-ribose deacetylase (regulator of RNase III)
MSTAWYRSNVVPSLVRRWTASASSSTSTASTPTPTPTLLLDAIEVWDTTCVVTNFGLKDSTTPKTSNSNTASAWSSPPRCSILINPANPNLSGVSDFPYFPKGGPQPTRPAAKDAHHIMGYVTQWGGMDVGQGMMFAANVVDGLVHQLGGKELQHELSLVGSSPGSCPEGMAVWTRVPESTELRSHYEAIVHTVPPFYGHSDHALLEKCYQSSLQLIQEHATSIASTFEDDDDDDQQQGTSNSRTTIRVACPLLGAGCRGFPSGEAMERAAAVLVDACHATAATATASMVDDNDKSSSISRPTITLAFAIPSGELRTTLVETIDRHWNTKFSSDQE